MFRLHLLLGALTACLLIFTLFARKQNEFDFQRVIAVAAEKVRSPYAPPGQDLPDFLRKLDYDQTRDIRWRDDLTLWRREGLPFQIKFFQRTGRQSDRVDVFTVRGSSIQRVVYSPQQFDFGKNRFPQQVPDNLGYAGFRVHYPLNKREHLDEVIVFLGACYFRAVGKGQQYGLSARAVAVDAGFQMKEEFPRFTTFWLREPARNSNVLEFYGLLEGPSLVGAYEFRLIPGDDTRVEVRAVNFIRQKIKRLGIAPLTSMYWFGENYRSNIQDFRPEVHDSDGLLIADRQGDWIWRPLSNAVYMRENSFMDENPVGFGLLQRDRDFRNYQDLESNYHRRPSVWIEAVGEWGKGKIDLLQLPTNNEFADNVITFWSPDGEVGPGTVLEHRYVMHWYSQQADRPPLATATQTRIHYPVTNEPALFVIDFAGNGLEKIPADKPPGLVVETVPPNLAQNVVVQPNPYAEGWRATFAIPKPAKPGAVDLRCRLMNNDKPLTETWTYTWEVAP